MFKKIVIWLIVIILLGVGYYFLKPIIFKPKAEINLLTQQFDAVSVSISNSSFSPSSLTIKKGQTVTWTNNDVVQHKVVGDTLEDLSGPIMNQSYKYSYTFNDIGNFDYHCAIHTGMRGKVTVTE